MRTLKFIVDNDTLMKDNSCSFAGLFPGTNQDIRAEFSFSPGWTGISKVAAFYSMLEKEYAPQIIDNENGCIIPPEALNLPAFKMQVLGNNRGKIITTNTYTVYQKGGNA